MEIYEVEDASNTDMQLNDAFNKSPIIRIDGIMYMKVPPAHYNGDGCRGCAFKDSEVDEGVEAVVCDCPLICNIVGHVEEASELYVDLLKVQEESNE
jgi:hypothetical protein